LAQRPRGAECLTAKECAHARERLSCRRSSRCRVGGITLDDADGAEAGDGAGDAGEAERLDDQRRILVGLGHLLGERLAGAGGDDDTAPLELGGDVAIASRAPRCVRDIARPAP